MSPSFLIIGVFLTSPRFAHDRKVAPLGLTGMLLFSFGACAWSAATTLLRLHLMTAAVEFNTGGAGLQLPIPAIKTLVHLVWPLGTFAAKLGR